MLFTVISLRKKAVFVLSKAPEEEVDSLQRRGRICFMILKGERKGRGRGKTVERRARATAVRLGAVTCCLVVFASVSPEKLERLLGPRIFIRVDSLGVGVVEFTVILWWIRSWEETTGVS